MKLSPARWRDGPGVDDRARASEHAGGPSSTSLLLSSAASRGKGWQAAHRSEKHLADQPAHSTYFPGLPPSPGAGHRGPPARGGGGGEGRRQPHLSRPLPSARVTALRTKRPGAPHPRDPKGTATSGGRAAGRRSRLQTRPRRRPLGSLAQASQQRPGTPHTLPEGGLRR